MLNIACNRFSHDWCAVHYIKESMLLWSRQAYILSNFHLRLNPLSNEPQFLDQLSTNVPHFGLHLCHHLNHKYDTINLYSLTQLPLKHNRMTIPPAMHCSSPAKRSIHCTWQSAYTSIPNSTLVEWFFMQCYVLVTKNSGVPLYGKGSIYLDRLERVPTSAPRCYPGEMFF